MTKILTQRGVEAAKPQTKRYGKPDGLIPGMQLIVQPSGAKSFALLARLGGKLINVRLGPTGVLTLAQAREEARSRLGMIASGKDPRTVRRDARPDIETFAIVARRFIERHAKARNRSWREFRRLIEREAVPRWGSRPVDGIAKQDVIALLDGIVDRGSPITANRTLGVLRRLFNWCIERGALEASPCDRIKRPAPEFTRDRVLDDSELALVWQAAGALAYPYGPMVRLLIITGQRRNEVAGMRWGELAPDLASWALPAERTKNATWHSIPIPKAVRDILVGLPRIAGEAGYVFTAGGKSPASGNFSRAKRGLDVVVTGLNGGTPIRAWTFHDLRRTAASGMARLGVGLPVIEKVLNHRSGSFAGVVGVYQRHDYRSEMAAALEAWARHVLALAEPEAGLLRVGASR
jgi:integrase